MLTNKMTVTFSKHECTFIYFLITPRSLHSTNAPTTFVNVNGKRIKIRTPDRSSFMENRLKSKKRLQTSALHLCLYARGQDENTYNKRCV